MMDQVCISASGVSRIDRKLILSVGYQALPSLKHIKQISAKWIFGFVFQIGGGVLTFILVLFQFHTDI